MAQMIPSHISTNSPKAEREIFMKLKDDPNTEDWIVLHSLDIANHVSQVQGEIDFVIIIPGGGILVAELKGGLYISYEEGTWKMRSNIMKDPFKQVNDAKHSLKDFLDKNMPVSSSIPVGSIVIFPYAEIPDESIEWQPWQCIDKNRYERSSLVSLLKGSIDKTREHLGEKGRVPFGNDDPSPELCQRLASVLRPNFEYYESPKTRIKRLTEEIKQYTNEQLYALDMMSANDRVLFRGPAGTGKTLLAIEAARRAAASEKKVLIACYNRALKLWLDDQLRDYSDHITCNNIHSLMLSLPGVNVPEGKTIGDIWGEIIPEQAIEALMDARDPDAFTYDEIVLDEAQDIIINPLYLDFLDLSLRNGLTRGIWRFFGDFERQMIYGKTEQDVADILSQRSVPFSNCGVSINCRNTPRIAQVTKTLGGLESGYSKILRPDEGVEPGFHFYKDMEDQAKTLVDVLEKLKEEDYPTHSIVILSRRSDESCSASMLESPEWRNVVKPLRELKENEGHVCYCSIHAFKGLEKPVVIVTDLDEIDTPESQSLCYIAATRAVHRLEMLIHESQRQRVEKMLKTT